MSHKPLLRKLRKKLDRLSKEKKMGDRRAGRKYRHIESGLRRLAR